LGAGYHDFTANLQDRTGELSELEQVDQLRIKKPYLEIQGTDDERDLYTSHGGTPGMNDGVGLRIHHRESHEEEILQTNDGEGLWIHDRESHEEEIL
jgi:hypothetical protein